MKIYLQIIVVLLMTTNVYAGEVQAPFGFHWGESKQQITKQGVKLVGCNTDLSLTLCNTKKAIKSVSFGEAYQLLFDSRKGLQKIVMVSTNFTRDAAGLEGKALYEKIKNSLTKKYGEADANNSIQISGLNLYNENDEFYQCLAYEGCGSWITLWTPKLGGNVSISLEGISRGVGFLKIGYESKEWNDIIDHRNAIKDSADINAL